jgi:hypothetical protein
MLYDVANDEYFKNTDDEAKNEDRLHNAIVLLAVGYIFKDYSIKVAEGNWFDLWLAYRADYDRAVNEMQLSIDRDESGEITDDEERESTQTYLTR